MKNFYVTYEEALKVVLSQGKALPKEKVSLFESLGRTLAEDVKADRDNPALALSAMDGYAVKSSNIREIPAVLKVVGESRAGIPFKGEVKEGEAVRIFTGAPVPKGANAVVPVEFTEEKDGKVKVSRYFPEGANVRERGEDFKEGEVLVERGTLITPVEMGIIASVGKPFVSVTEKPRVAVVVTGSEIVEPGEELKEPYAVRNANAYLLHGLVREAGGEPVYFGIVEDERGKTEEVLVGALNSCHVVLTTGGISAGKYDFVRDVLPEIGVETLFYKLKVKPGKPVFFGKRGSKFVFSLPGFPVSTVVSFNLLVFPFIRKLLGAKELFRKRVKGKLVKAFKRRKAERKEFVRCRYWYDSSSGTFKAEPVERQGSGVLSLMAGNVCLMEVPIGTDFIPEGETVELILIK